MQHTLTMTFRHFAFLWLFAAEFTFYLLILQTGVVEQHHSVLSEIWMVPAGGMIGIILSVFADHRYRGYLPVLLALQLLLCVEYADAGGPILFALGLISGLTAPVLIARVTHFSLVVVALALSYAMGTWFFSVLADSRTSIALFLSAVALAGALFGSVEAVYGKAKRDISVQSAVAVFFWLLLDALLFETLSRDSVMHIWGEETYTGLIIFSHLVGLAVAYRMRDWRYNSRMILLLFTVTFIVYSTGWQWGLSLVYPFVISYYNVIILRRLTPLAYPVLAVMALTLWGASGLGLLGALTKMSDGAWLILGILAAMELSVVSEYLTKWNGNMVRAVTRLKRFDLTF